MEQKRCPVAVGKKRQDGGENMKYVKLKMNLISYILYLIS